MSYEAWGEPEDPPELPDGWWDEYSVTQMQDAIKALVTETMYADGKMQNGVSVRFLARITIAQKAAGLLAEDDPIAIEAELMLAPNKDSHDSR